MVIEETGATWQRALVRAQARGLRLRRLERSQVGYDVVERFAVTSASRPGLLHTVALRGTAAGLEVLCSCEGGQRGQACQHAAAVLRYRDLLGADVQVQQPAPVAAAVVEQPRSIARGSALARLYDDDGDDPWGPRPAA